ncbi:MAG: MucB/RseB C-terminal domain-containing protein [Methylococcaceae bacterium]
MITRIFFLIIILTIKTVSAQESHPNGKQTLIKMTQAMHVLNYQGTVAFLKNGKLEPMKYFHAARKGQEQERLLSLNSPLREIIRDSGLVSCLYKTTQQLIIDHRPFEHSFLVDTPRNIDDLDSLYEIDVIGEENIALRPAYIINIQPKDNLRYARKVWVEKQHFLPLKVIVYDLSGQILEQFVFTELEVKELLPFVDSKPSELSNPQPIFNQQAPSSDQATFTVFNGPRGFREIFFTRRTMHNSEQPVDHLLLGDGLASVSVYLEHSTTPASTRESSDTVQSIGTVNFFSQILQEFELTVMGEVPAETIKLIAKGIKLRNTRH